MQVSAVCKHAVDILEGFTDQLLTADMSDLTGGDEGTVMTVFFCLFGGQIAFGAAAELDQEGLFTECAGADLVAVVEEQLKGVRGNGNGAETDNVNLGVDGLDGLLQFKAADHAEVDLQIGNVVVVYVAGMVAQIFLDTAFCVMKVCESCTTEGSCILWM